MKLQHQTSKMNAKRFSTYSFGFCASHLQNQLQYHIKNKTWLKASLEENWQEFTHVLRNEIGQSKSIKKLLWKKMGLISLNLRKKQVLQTISTLS